MSEFTMEKIEQEIADLKEMVKDLHRLLVGHEHDEAVGLLHWKKESEKRITTLEKFKDKIIWVGIGMSIPGGLGVFKIVEYLLKVIQ